MEVDNEPDEAVVAVTSISCFLSMIGSLVIILTYLVWKDIRTSSRQLLVFLSITDFVTAGGYAFGNIMNHFYRYVNGSQTIDDHDADDTPLWCIIESAVANTAQMMSFFWTLCIAIFLYITIVHGSLRHIRKYKICFHIVSWVVPSVIMAVALSQRMIGSDLSMTSVGWCWIKVPRNDTGPDHTNTVLWMLLVGKGWEIASYFILPIIYLLIKIHIWKFTKRPVKTSPTIQQETLDAMIRVNRKLTFIPLVFLLLRVWGTARFFMYLTSTGDGSNVILQAMHGIGDSFQGGANCIIFCVCTKSVRQHFKDCFRKYCCCWRREPSLSHGERTPLIYSRNSTTEKAMTLPSSLRIP